MGRAGAQASGRAAPAVAPEATVVVSGKVVKREEVWDRRTNPMMGRPDILKEIVLAVSVSHVISGTLPPGADNLRVSIAGESTLIKFKYLSEGWSGDFHLAEKAGDYALVEVSGGMAPPKPRPVPRPVVQGKPQPRENKPLPFPENLGGRDVRKSRSLQGEAVRVIARRYGMKDASAVFLVSNSGPRPPRGGYVYWGVKGRIAGKWHIWQPGYGKPRPGTDLEDPKRYQK